MKVYKLSEVACETCGCHLQPIYSADVKQPSGVRRTFLHTETANRCPNVGKYIQVGFNYVKTAKEVTR